MGRFDTIKTTIDANIKENGNQEITGQKINSVLTEMVNVTDAEFADLESQVEKKQDALVDGENIKTINGQSILGKGNIAIHGGEGGSVIVDSELSDTSVNPIANSAVTAALKEINEAKQDTIEDLETIREGAKKGATAIQKVKTINNQSIEGEGNITIEGGGGEIDTSDFATKIELQTEIDLVEQQIAGVTSAIPTKTSQLNNDSGLATEDYVNQQVRNSIISALNTEV